MWDFSQSKNVKESSVEVAIENIMVCALKRTLGRKNKISYSTRFWHINFNHVTKRGLYDKLQVAEYDKKIKQEKIKLIFPVCITSLLQYTCLLYTSRCV